jgi:hypothetical protein
VETRKAQREIPITEQEFTDKIDGISALVTDLVKFIGEVKTRREDATE